MALETVFARADEYWAALLGCTPEALRGEAAVFQHARSPDEIVAVFRAGSWKLSISPAAPAALLASLQHSLAAFSTVWASGDSQAIDEAHRQLRAWLAAQIDTVFYGPAELVYCTLDTLLPAPTVEYRELSADDSAAILEFQDAMGGWLAWDITAPAHWLRIIGAFEQERLVATAGLYAWENQIAELYVDTVPDRRGRGYATALGSIVTRWVLEQTPLLAQSGGELTNIASAKMSSYIGYQIYGMLFMNDFSRTGNNTL